MAGIGDKSTALLVLNGKNPGALQTYPIDSMTQQA